MPNTSHIHVRPLEISDFSFVQDLASKQQNFTVPPTYVLWLTLRIKGAISLVAEHSTRGPLAYLLAVPIDGPEESMFVWQLAVSKGTERAKATLALLAQFRDIVGDLAVRNIVFSSVPNSSAFRAIRRYASKVFSSVPEAISTLPLAVDAKESEFLLDLGHARRVGSRQTSTRVK